MDQAIPEPPSAPQSPPPGPHRREARAGQPTATGLWHGPTGTILRWTPLAVLATLLTLVVVSALALNQAVDDGEMDRFRREVQTTQDRIVGRLDTYVTSLLGAQATLSVIDPLDTEKLRLWFGQLGIPRRHAGVQGIGFNYHVPAGQRESMTAEMRRRGHADFHIWPGAVDDVACPVILVDPMEGVNQGMVGFDMCSEPVRRAAMEQARDTGLPTASDRVTPIHQPADVNLIGFLVFVPVFRGGIPPSVEQRRRDLLGFVYARFRANDLFRGIVGAEQHPLLAFTIEDADGPSRGQMLYQSDDDDPRRPSRRAISITAPVAGRDWRMVFRSRPAFEAQTPRYQVWFLLGAGLMVGLAVTLLVRAQVRARGQAEESEAWIRFAWEATAHAASSLDPLTMAESLARYCLPTLGEWCAMDVLDDDGQPSRVMLTPVDPANEELAAALRRYPSRGRSNPIVARVLAEKRGLRFELNDQLLAAGAQDQAHLDLIRRANVRGLMVVPLISRGRALGLLSVLRARSYNDRDMVVLEDVGRRVAMALDSARLYRQAQEAVRTRDAFLSMASHELKAPLTTLQLQAQGLQRMIQGQCSAPLDQSQLVHRVTVIDRQAKRLTSLIDDMMDVSRIAAGRLICEVQDIDLVHLVREVVQRLEDESGQSGSSLEMELPASAIGRWDRARLDQVLTNLLSNALKYGEQQPVAISIETSPGMARVCVRDRGIGIAVSNHERIFEPFERFVSGPKYQGSGLGLWITRQIVEAQGGRVLVESEPGQGARFVVELPTGH